MNSQKPTILAIAPGKKCFGFAVFTAGVLTHFSRHGLGHGTAKTLLRKQIPSLLDQMIASFDPQVIVVRVASQYQKTSTILAPATKVVERDALRRRIKLVPIALPDIKSRLCYDERATQGKAFRHLAQLYPELNRFVKDTGKWQERYYRPLLAAVSAGFTYLKSLG